MWRTPEQNQPARLYGQSSYCLGVTSPSEVSCSWNWASNPESRNDQPGNDHPGVNADRSLCSSETFQASVGVTGCLTNLVQVAKEVGEIRFQLFQEQTPKVAIRSLFKQHKNKLMLCTALCSVLVGDLVQHSSCSVQCLSVSEHGQACIDSGVGKQVSLHTSLCVCTELKM